jgi:hypothetical protein
MSGLIKVPIGNGRTAVGHVIGESVIVLRRKAKPLIIPRKELEKMRDIQQEPEVALCEVCDAELYENYEVLIYDNMIICDWECLRELIEPSVETRILARGGVTL